MVKKLYEWKPIPTRLTERPKIRWENDTKEDLRITKINGQNLPNNVRVKNSRIMRQALHVEFTGQIGNAYIILVRNTALKRLLVTPRY
jgi:hypothetical protein